MLFEASPTMLIPLDVFPEIKFPSPTPAPPIVVLAEELRELMPSPGFPIAAVNFHPAFGTKEEVTYLDIRTCFTIGIATAGFKLKQFAVFVFKNRHLMSSRYQRTNQYRNVPDTGKLVIRKTKSNTNIRISGIIIRTQGFSFVAGNRVAACQTKIRTQVPDGACVY